MKGKDILKSQNILKSLYPARYILFLMGFFACYCGWIYNDFTSLTFNFFGSCYDPNVFFFIIINKIKLF